MQDPPCADAIALVMTRYAFTLDPAIDIDTGKSSTCGKIVNGVMFNGLWHAGCKVENGSYQTETMNGRLVKASPEGARLVQELILQHKIPGTLLSNKTAVKNARLQTGDKISLACSAFEVATVAVVSLDTELLDGASPRARTFQRILRTGLYVKDRQAVEPEPEGGCGRKRGKAFFLSRAALEAGDPKKQELMRAVEVAFHMALKAEPATITAHPLYPAMNELFMPRFQGSPSSPHVGIIAAVFVVLALGFCAWLHFFKPPANADAGLTSIPAYTTNITAYTNITAQNQSTLMPQDLSHVESFGLDMRPTAASASVSGISAASDPSAAASEPASAHRSAVLAVDGDVAAATAVPNATTPDATSASPEPVRAVPSELCPSPSFNAAEPATISSTLTQPQQPSPSVTAHGAQPQPCSDNYGSASPSMIALGLLGAASCRTGDHASGLSYDIMRWLQLQIVTNLRNWQEVLGHTTRAVFGDREVSATALWITGFLAVLLLVRIFYRRRCSARGLRTRGSFSRLSQLRISEAGLAGSLARWQLADADDADQQGRRKVEQGKAAYSALAVFHAVRAGDVHRLEHLINADKSLLEARDESGHTLLTTAATFGYPFIVALLVQLGCDPNARLDCGSTAMHFAARNGHLETVKQLLLSRASLMVLNCTGFSPLHLSAIYGFVEVSKLLIEHSDSSLLSAAAGSAKATALHAAASEGKAPVVRLLLENGSDREAMTSAGQTAYDLANERGHVNICSMLSGADLPAAGGANVTPQIQRRHEGRQDTLTGNLDTPLPSTEEPSASTASSNANSPSSNPGGPEQNDHAEPSLQIVLAHSNALQAAATSSAIVAFHSKVSFNEEHRVFVLELYAIAVTLTLAYLVFGVVLPGKWA